MLNTPTGTWPVLTAHWEAYYKKSLFGNGYMASAGPFASMIFITTHLLAFGTSVYESAVWAQSLSYAVSGST